MKKRFKGFTLIECLIALAVLGIASLTMAQIYAGVARKNRTNQLLNTSLSNQMAYVEKYTSTEAVPIYFNESGGASQKDANASTTDRKPPHKSGGNTHQNNYVQITRIDSTKTGAASRDKDQVYSFPVDTYILLSRDDNDRSSGTTIFDDQYYDYLMDSTNNKDKNYNLRYKYLVSHAN